MSKYEDIADSVRPVAEAALRAEEHKVKISVDSLRDISAKMAVTGYVLTPDTVRILEDYLSGYNIWMVGPPGVGKTMFFKSINAVRKSKNIQEISILPMMDTRGWKMEDVIDWMSYRVDMDIVIDDVGVEPVMNFYGVKGELFPYLLEVRMKSRRRTHLTSNIDANDVYQRYGVRVADRFVEMFKREEIKAKESKRKLRRWTRPSSV